MVDAERVRAVLARFASVVCFAASGMVFGFCTGRFLGPLILGHRGGHGMADLGYLFMGAFLGVLGGGALGLQQALTKAARRALVAGLVSVGLAALLALVTFVVSNLSHTG